MWLINRMPNFGDKPRPAVRYQTLHPMLQEEPSNADYGDDALERALDAYCERMENRSQ